MLDSCHIMLDKLLNRDFFFVDVNAKTWISGIPVYILPCIPFFIWEDVRVN